MSPHPLDFDTAVNFVWKWTAQFNAHMARCWGEGTDGDNLGFREDIIEMIGKSMLEHIFSHSTPEILMDAYSAQLTLLMSHTEFPLLPKKYFVVADNTLKLNIQHFMDHLNQDAQKIVKRKNVLLSQAENLMNCEIKTKLKR